MFRVELHKTANNAIIGGAALERTMWTAWWLLVKTAKVAGVIEPL